MSYKDRGSPILLESGLKSFLGHPGHNYPLINVWPRDNYGYISMSTSDNGCCQQVRVSPSAPYEQHPPSDNDPVNRNWSQDQPWLPSYFNQQNGVQHKTCIHPPARWASSALVCNLSRRRTTRKSNDDTFNEMNRLRNLASDN